MAAGITDGIQVGIGQLTPDLVEMINNGGGGTGPVPYLFRQRQALVGAIDGSNRDFNVPSPDKFIDGIFNNNEFHIYVTHNGQGIEIWN